MNIYSKHHCEIVFFFKNQFPKNSVLLREITSQAPERTKSEMSAPKHILFLLFMKKQYS